MRHSAKSLNLNKETIIENFPILGYVTKNDEKRIHAFKGLVSCTVYFLRLKTKNTAVT